MRPIRGAGSVAALPVRRAGSAAARLLGGFDGRRRRHRRRRRHDGRRARDRHRAGLGTRAAAGTEQRELELQPQTADAVAIGVDRREPARGGRQRGHRSGGRDAVAEALEELRAKRVDDLVEERPAVPAALLEVVEDPHARRHVPADQRVDEPADRLGIGEPEQAADAGLVDRAVAGGQELVEHRLGVAHAARGEPRDEPDGLGLGRPTVGLEDHGELAFDLRDRESPDVVPLEARQDRRREARRLGRGEHEEDEGRRLLERLEQRVPRVLRDLVRLVEDVDLPPQVRGRVVDPLAQVADGVDAAVRCGVDLDEVEGAAFADADARRARVARIAVLQVRAVDGLGDDAREGGLAGAARTDEQDRVRDPVSPDRVPEGLDDRLLADDLAERLRSPAPVEGLMGDGRRHDPPSRANPESILPCTLRRSERPRAHTNERLGPGRSAAPDDGR